KSMPIVTSCSRRKSWSSVAESLACERLSSCSLSAPKVTKDPFRLYTLLYYTPSAHMFGVVYIAVVCVEKRDEFSRNNVIHLWPNVINDMYTFEAKRMYGQFCVGSIDHISIRQLQLILLKIAIIYGLKFVQNV